MWSETYEVFHDKLHLLLHDCVAHIDISGMSVNEIDNAMFLNNCALPLPVL